MATMKAALSVKEKALFALLIVGMALSLFLLYEHFAPEASSICDFGGSLDCGVVNTSPYANLDGISYLLVFEYGLPVPFVDISGIHPVFDFLTTNAFLGFLTLLFVAVLFYFRVMDKDFWFIRHGDQLTWIRGILTFGVFYGLYLFYIQHSVLLTYCVFCLALDVTLISSAVLAWTIE